jgi:hypothetical protein
MLTKTWHYRQYEYYLHKRPCQDLLRFAKKKFQVRGRERRRASATVQGAALRRALLRAPPRAFDREHSVSQVSPQRRRARFDPGARIDGPASDGAEHVHVAREGELKIAGWAAEPASRSTRFIMTTKFFSAIVLRLNGLRRLGNTLKLAARRVPAYPGVVVGAFSSTLRSGCPDTRFPLISGSPGARKSG